MNTDEWIDFLSRGAGPAPRVVAAWRLAPAMAGGWLAAVGLVWWLHGLLPASAFATVVPWMKLAYALALAAGGAWLVARLARPLGRWRHSARWLLAVPAGMMLLGLWSLVQTPPGERLDALLGMSWWLCPILVLLLALPTLAGLIWALRGLAPVQLRAAGAVAGLVAGGCGAAAYALACPEASPAFVAVWYSLGIGLSLALGAWLGPRLLRW